MVLGTGTDAGSLADSKSLAEQVNAIERNLGILDKKVNSWYETLKKNNLVPSDLLSDGLFKAVALPQGSERSDLKRRVKFLTAETIVSLGAKIEHLYAVLHMTLPKRPSPDDGTAIVDIEDSGVKQLKAKSDRLEGEAGSLTDLVTTMIQSKVLPRKGRGRAVT